MALFKQQSTFNTSREDLFDWHERPGAFKRLSPPWQKVRVLSQEGHLKEGAKVALRLSFYGLLRLKWILSHGQYKKGHLFVDNQVKGPFKYWKHEHQFISQSSHQSSLIDKITYELQWGLGEKKVSQDLTRLFRYRHTILKHDLALINKWPTKAQTIAISGASGFIGQELTHFLTTAGHQVIALTRTPKNDKQVLWDYETDQFDYDKLEGIDSIIHLAGDNIGSGRWSKSKKKRIYDSRILGTRLLVNGLNRLKKPPKVLISVSGMGYYGYQPSTLVNEQSLPGNDFLSQVCCKWEQEALKYQGGRVVTPRLGMVLSPKAGALKKLLLPTLLGLGGVCGSGDQWVPWIGIDDLVYSFYNALMDHSINGPINFIAGPPISNKTLITTLGSLLHRPTILPLPQWLLKVLFGEMAEATLLSSVQAQTTQPIMSENNLCYPHIKDALKHMLGKA